MYYKFTFMLLLSLFGSHLQASESSWHDSRIVAFGKLESYFIAQDCNFLIQSGIIYDPQLNNLWSKDKNKTTFPEHKRIWTCKLKDQQTLFNLLNIKTDNDIVYIYFDYWFSDIGQRIPIFNGHERLNKKLLANFNHT